jgi:hypothetical protein
MPSIPYGTGAYRRTNGNFPELKLINLFVEQAKTSENGVALLSSPGLSVSSTVGTGPINGLFSKEGTFSGDVFAISGTALYRAGAAVASGTIAGTGPAKFAGGDLELVVTRGATARSYLSSGIADIAFPDSASVRSVTYIGSLFVYVRDDSAKFYWSNVLDGRTIDPLNFATAEREPDSLLDIAALGDNIWLFGQQTVEVWAHTGEADLPFSRLENVALDKGIVATGAVVKADNSLFFVGSNRSVYRAADVPQRISDHSIEERILASSSVRLLTYLHEGHEIVAVRLDTETLCYDCATQEWFERQSNGGQWNAAHACTVNGATALFGHQTTGQLMGLSGHDDAGDEMELRFTAAMPLDRPLSIDRLRLWANVGHTDLLTGQGSDPVVEMRFSDDAGTTWSDWEPASLGVQGDYREVPEWRCLGQFDFPGIMLEFRVTDPVGLRISAVKINDPGGRRA